MRYYEMSLVVVATDPACSQGVPIIGGVLGDSGESGGRAAVKPLLPAADVANDFTDGMWNAVRFRMRLLSGKSVENSPQARDGFRPSAR